MSERASVPAAALRRAAELARALCVDGAPEAAERVSERLERDLLPRTVQGAPYLVVGVAGPNNAGKSSLVNALVGRPLSRSAARGGATRRLVGAAHPELLTRLAAEPSLSRFALRTTPIADIVDAALDGEAPADELLVAEVDELSRELLLVDAPDFDSVLPQNRRASESLLAVADLVLVVVTPLTYHNRVVVDFLRRWLAHGRPWMLVYNQGGDEESARAHADALAADVGTPPLSRWWQPLSLGVQSSNEAIAPCSLDEPEGPGLAQALRELDEVQRVKRRALVASLRQLASEVGDLERALEEREEVARRLHDTGRGLAQELAREVAAEALPAGPFLEALRDVLESRGHPLARRLRGGVRRFGLQVRQLVARLKRGGAAASEDGIEARLAAAESEALERGWSRTWEQLVREVDGGLEVHGEAMAPALREALVRDLCAGRREAARAEFTRRASLESSALSDFRLECVELVEQALAERGREWDLQLAVDFATALPLALATALVVTTGGVGADLGVAGGGLAGSVVLERYAHFLGAGCTREARRRWTEARARELEQLIFECCFAEGAARFEAELGDGLARARELGALARNLCQGEVDA